MDIRVGIIFPNWAMGGCSRNKITISQHLKDIRWSGVAIQSDIILDDHAAASMPCPIYCPNLKKPYTNVFSTKSFDEAIDIVAKQSDILILWGQFNSPISHNIKKFGIPVVAEAHGSCRWTRVALEECLPCATHYLACSQASKRVFPPSVMDQVEIIYNSIDLRRVQPHISRKEQRRLWNISNDMKVIAYIGRLSMEKNPLSLAHAISSLSEEWHGVYIGTGWKEEDIKKEAHKVAGNRVSFFPSITQVGNALNAIDIILMNSTTEGDCQMLKEAWAACTPVVSTPVGSIPELESKYGTLVVGVPLDATKEELVDAIQYAISDDNKYVIKKARKVVIENFLSSNIGFQYNNLMKKIFLETQKDNLVKPSIRIGIISKSLLADQCGYWMQNICDSFDNKDVAIEAIIVTDQKKVNPEIASSIACHAKLIGISPKSENSNRFYSIYDSIPSAVNNINPVDAWIHVQDEFPDFEFNGPKIAFLHKDASNYQYVVNDYKVDKSHTIWSGINPKLLECRYTKQDIRRQWNIPEDSVVIGLSERNPKNILLPAIAAIGANKNNYVVIAGLKLDTGYASQELKRLINEYPNRMILRETDHSDFYKVINVFISNHTTHWGMSIHKAMMSGVPVISNETGILLELKNSFKKLATILPTGYGIKEIQDAINIAISKDTKIQTDEIKMFIQNNFSNKSMGERWTRYLESIIFRRNNRYIKSNFQSDIIR